MFNGSVRKKFEYRRYPVESARRRSPRREGNERVQFGEIDGNSRAPSPGSHANTNLSDYTEDNFYTRQENKSPRRTREVEGHNWKHTNHRKFYHRKRMEHSIDQRPSTSKARQEKDYRRGEHRSRNYRKTRRASPKGGSWTPDSMRGFEKHVPSRKGGHRVLTPSERLGDKWNEEYLSLRFADPPQTECATCLHHHGIDPLPPPNHDYHQEMLERLLSSFPSKEYLEAEESLRKGVGDRWWAKTHEEPPCRRCSSHHTNQEEMQNLTKELKRIDKEISNLRAQVGERTTSGQQRVAQGSSRPSSPEFTTPPQEFARSRTPTPQRSYNYRDMYERKLRASHYVKHRPSFTSSGKMPRYDIAEYIRQLRDSIMQRKRRNSRGVSPTTWNPYELSPRKQKSPASFPQLHTSSKNKGDRFLKKVIKASPPKSPRWSKECLHKRELRSRINKREDDMVDTRVDTHQNGGANSRMNLGRALVGQQTQSPTNVPRNVLSRRMLSPNSQTENPQREVYNGIRALSRPANSPMQDKHILRSGSDEAEKRRKMAEKQESHWAPPSRWTAQQLSMKDIKQSGASPKKFFKNDRDFLRPKTQDLDKNMNSNLHMNVGDISRKITTSHRTALGSMQTAEVDSKGNTDAQTVHPEKSNNGYTFEVHDTEMCERRDSISTEPNLCRAQNSSPAPKHIFFSIPKLGSTDNYKDQKPSAHLSNSQVRQKSPMSTQKSDKDMKLRVDIRSEFPLDMVDGRLKQFLKGVGGLIYYSEKDGGVPRIKELSNYFSGKQPLLWFFPRSA